MVTEADRERVTKIHDKLLLGHMSSATFEARLSRSDGSQRIMDVKALRAEYENQATVLQVIRDVTDRKKMESQLLLADSMSTMGVLAAGER